MFQRLIAMIIPSSIFPSTIRLRMLRICGAQVGGARILPEGAYVGELKNIEIGEGSFVNRGCVFYANEKIVIGTNVAIGPDCLLMTGSHQIGGADRRASIPTVFRPVRIGNGSWIGARVTIQGGVTIGPGCVVASGAVIVRDCEPNGLYAGVPARRIRDLPLGGKVAD